MRFLCYANHADALPDIRAKLRHHKCQCDLVTDPAGLYRSPVSDREYTGLLIDVPSRIRAGSDAKATLARLEEIFPTLLIRMSGQEVRTFSSNAVGAGLDDFIEGCRLVTPRFIRQSNRLRLHFNVEVSPDSGMVPCETTVSMNVSSQGCFLFSTGHWKQGEHLWLRFRELSDSTPIEAEVRWNLPWGEGMRIPGFGMRFIRILPAQRDELRAYLKGERPPEKKEELS